MNQYVSPLTPSVSFFLSSGKAAFPELSISAAALLTSASICFAFSDVGADCCAMTGLTIAIPTKLTRTISATDNNRFIFSSFWKWYCFQCVYILCSLKHLLLTKTSSTTFTLHISLFPCTHPPPFWDHWDL